jgi:hypothetical protein
MERKLSKRKINFNWQPNTIGGGHHCVYYPLIKLHIFENYDLETDEFLGYQFFAYYCDHSYHSNKNFDDVDSCKKLAEKFAYKVLEKMIETLEGYNEHQKV